MPTEQQHKVGFVVLVVGLAMYAYSLGVAHWFQAEITGGEAWIGLWQVCSQTAGDTTRCYIIGSDLEMVEGVTEPCKTFSFFMKICMQC
jgi:hypothetical protein